MKKTMNFEITTIRIFAIFILGSLLFSSCEKETYVDYFIDNQSSGTISFFGSNIIHSTYINNSINSGQKKRVSGWSKRGKETGYFEPVTMFGNDLIITNSIGDTLIRDYKLLSNWSSNVDDQRAIARHEYVFIIIDADF
ncbi:MAG: hypothetical protein HKN92_07605 [Chitinophagales bacterium]|nr:hypothetical protein [Chitinophagales bacterium]